MKEIIEKELLIEDMIYKIRGVEVMLDSDLAKLYQVETKRINEAVKNNPDKFPERYSFKITESGYNFLKSKISTSKYSCGASFKDLGKKCFAINKIENDKILKELLKFL